MIPEQTPKKRKPRKPKVIQETAVKPVAVTPVVKHTHYKMVRTNPVKFIVVDDAGNPI
jgi:hypothetical protein